MQLPGRLRESTLGDLLGALHRDGATGTLELIETRGTTAGRAHRLVLEQGEIVRVEGGARTARLGALLGLEPQARRATATGEHLRIGEYLVAAGLVRPERLREVLRAQMRERLEAIFALEDAQIRFHAPRPRAEDPTAPTPLARGEFLEGRPRLRDRGRRLPESQPPRGRPGGSRAEALRVLGLAEGASAADIHRAFRQLAQEHHPDVFPHASPDERRERLRRFAELSRAYHTLTA
jgi:DnaJ-domain-containing protein 1